MKLFTLFFIISLSSSLSSYAQQDGYHWRIGAYSGVMTYYGDLNQRFLSPNKRLIDKPTDALSYGFSVEKSLSTAWSTKLLYTNGKFYANDRAIDWNGDADADNSNYGRSLNARTDIHDLSLMFTYYFDNDELLGRRAFVAPYLTFGAVVTDFEVMGDLFDDTGSRYYYWSDNTIRDLAENSSDAANAMVIGQDGIYETNLTDLQTERKYKNRVINIPFGAGLKFRLSSRFNLNLDYTARYAFTDYLDDVSGNYRQAYENDLQAYASNPTGSDLERRGKSGRNDFYGFISISLHYNFGKKTDNYIAPTIYPSSVYSETDRGMESRLHNGRYEEFAFDNLSTARLTRRSRPDFNPLPVKLDSISTVQSGLYPPDESQNNERSKDTIVLDMPTKIGDSLILQNKHLLQDDTIRQLEYEIRKIKLERELYELKNTFPDSSAQTETRKQTDTTALRYTPFASRPLYDSVMEKRTDQGQGLNLSSVNTTIDTSETSVSPADTVASGDRYDSQTADSTRLARMQNEINDLKRTLNASQNERTIVEENSPGTSEESILLADTVELRNQNERRDYDSTRFSQMQRQINDLQRTLEPRQNEVVDLGEEAGTADTSNVSIAAADTIAVSDSNYRLTSDSLRISQMQRQINDLQRTLNARQDEETQRLKTNTADSSGVSISPADTVAVSDPNYRVTSDSLRFSEMQRQIDDLQQTLNASQNEAGRMRKEISAWEDSSQVTASPQRSVALRDRNKSVNSVNTDSIQMVNMQRDINDLTRSLNARQNQANQSQGDKEALNQLRRRIDALSYELRNTQRVTRVIQREPNRSLQNRRDRQAAIDRGNLERKIDVLSTDVNDLRSNDRNERNNNTTQDSTTLKLLAESRRTQADLNNRINTLNSRLQATTLNNDSIEERRVTAERDSLAAQVARLQKSLETLRSEKPDTVERQVITIPDLPKTEVFFPVNSAVISESDNQRIREVASIIKKYPQMSVIIRGYTDKTGSLKYNLMLSEKRALAVEKILTSSNVSPARIMTESNGVDTDIKKKASQYGRRVEIILSSETPGR